MADSQPKPPDRFRSHFPALAASAVMTVVVATATSYLGVGGTILGMAGGSILSGAGAWWGERALKRSAELAQAKARAARVKGRPLTPAETQLIEAARDRRDRNRGHPGWRLAGALAAAAFVACAATLTIVEQAVGKPVADIVTGRPGHGTTLGGSAAGTAPPPGPAPAYTPTAAPSAYPAVPSSAPPSLYPSYASATAPAPAGVPSPSPDAPAGASPPASPPGSTAVPSLPAATATAP